MLLAAYLRVVALRVFCLSSGPHKHKQISYLAFIGIHTIYTHAVMMWLYLAGTMHNIRLPITNAMVCVYIQSDNTTISSHTCPGPAFAVQEAASLEQE